MNLERRYKVGVRLVDWAQGYGNRIFGGILDFLREGHEFDLEFEQASGGDLPRVNIDQHWEGDGLIVFRYTTAEGCAWASKGIPVVNLSVEQPKKGPNFPRVTMDNLLCGRQAAEKLMSMGLRNFAYWHDPNRVYSCERLEGYRAALREKGCDCKVLEVPASSYPPSSRARQVAATGWRVLAPLEVPFGLFAKDDIAAVCALRVMAQLGVQVPGEAVVLGVNDDLVYCLAARPALSSLRYPGRGVGYVASELLLRMMMKEKIRKDARFIVSSPGVIERESTGKVILPDELVSRAVALIRDEVTSGELNAGVLAARLGVSRELLRQRFHRVFGHGPKQEMDSVRATRVRELLMGTRWTLEKIAEQTGFGAQDELCRFYKRVTGKQPSEHRRRR